MFQKYLLLILFLFSAPSSVRAMKKKFKNSDHVCSHQKLDQWFISNNIDLARNNTDNSIPGLSALLNNGADTNFQCSSGNKALILAVKEGNKDVVELLLNAGIDPNIPDEYGRTPLMFAAEAGHKNIVELLIKSEVVDLNARSKHMPPYYCRPNAIEEGIYKDHTDIVDLLLKAGANPNLQDTSGDTTLMCAVRHGNIVIVKLLLDFGANPNIPDNDGETALSWTKKLNRINIALLLKKHGARSNNPDIQNEKDKIKSLLWAVICGEIEYVKSLLDVSVNPNIPDKVGKTPLNWAEDLNYTEITALLKEHGAK